MVHYVMMIRTSSYITILILCHNDTLSLHGYFSLYDTGVDPEFSGRGGLVITLGNTELYLKYLSRCFGVDRELNKK